MPDLFHCKKFESDYSVQVFVYIGTHVRVKCDKSLAKYSKINASKVSSSSLFTSEMAYGRRYALGSCSKTLKSLMIFVTTSYVPLEQIRA